MSTILFCTALIYANALGWAVFFAAGRYAPSLHRPAYWWNTAARNAPPSRPGAP